MLLEKCCIFSVDTHSLLSFVRSRLLVDLECITDSGRVLFYEGENLMELKIKAEEKAL